MLTPLKNYQIINCGWMRRREMRASAPRGGILADQMGLGKTVTCLANIVNGRPLESFPPHLQPESHTTLIVVPSSLLGQWKKEIRLHVKQEFRRKDWGLGWVSVFRDSESEQHHPMDFESQDIILTTYHDVRSSWPAYEIPEGLSEAERQAFWMENVYEKRGPLHRYRFLRIVLDEGHVIANPETQIANACFNLVADHKWVLTGTPMVNGSKDLYSLLSFIEHPTVMNMQFESFKSHFCNTRDPMSLDALSQEMVDSVACFTHKDKLFDARLITLPKPHNTSLKINPTELEKEIYDIIRTRFKERAQTFDENGEPRTKQFHIWAMFTLLRQLTAHPLLVPMKVCDYLEPEDFVKLDKADVAYGDYIGCFKRSANYHVNSERTACCYCGRANDNPVMTSCYHFYCHTHMEDLLNEAARRDVDHAICVKEGCGKVITRSLIIDPEVAMKPKYLDADGNVLPSTKTLAIKAQVLNWIDPKSGGDPDAKCIIFCQWKTFLRLLSQICETEKWDYVTLHGSMTKKTRDANIEKFKNVASVKILIATLKTGGVGLNLTCARYVINVDPYWNSAGEIQAFSRVYRIGQQEETEFVNLTLAGTIDEHLNGIKERKKKEIDQVTAGHKKLTMKDLLKTFEPTVEEKNSEESASE
ncbi:hypothetical protein M436DRAFT_45269 [Aureobasidium namibiae CBS 147.97]|uniref:P-loop containing nucleoside triphosphate hydrolase protein n=1 Tax=Aureobasidium namibiae CBS 147.97 TaxID=1043004 RepID=A0A074WKY8_9PEZI|nr:uncharacterized protein M436DRAFT_45269 [Aureobasidium namibiae CBS 147.97]KEQ73753.1 hypothetical protein M436DRAFT_45269 [Aureobasidium namibiae CBS 147.97]